jgi:hypothetical protein
LRSFFFDAKLRPKAGRMGSPNMRSWSGTNPMPSACRLLSSVAT